MSLLERGVLFSYSIEVLYGPLHTIHNAGTILLHWQYVSMCSIGTRTSESLLNVLDKRWDVLQSLLHQHLHTGYPMVYHCVCVCVCGCVCVSLSLCLCV